MAKRFSSGMVLLVAVQMAFTSLVQAEIYHWKDESGKTHFSDQRSTPIRGVRKTVTLKKNRLEKQGLDDLKNEVGKIVLKRVVHGRYQQYISDGALDSIKIIVVNHGMFSSEETAVISAKNTLDDWIPFAKQHKAIIIAPAFDNHNFATTGQCQVQEMVAIAVYLVGT